MLSCDCLSCLLKPERKQNGCNFGWVSQLLHNHAPDMELYFIFTLLLKCRECKLKTWKICAEDSARVPSSLFFRAHLGTEFWPLPLAGETYILTHGCGGVLMRAGVFVCWLIIVVYCIGLRRLDCSLSHFAMEYPVHTFAIYQSNHPIMHFLYFLAKNHFDLEWVDKFFCCSKNAVKASWFANQFHDHTKNQAMRKWIFFQNSSARK